MDGRLIIQCGDSRDALRKLGDATFDAVVTDPPYALGTLHDAGWDDQIAFDEKLWSEVLRVLKPGGWILSFGGARTYHRMACAVENAGAEIHDQLAWIYSSGFPRGKNPVPAIEKAGGDAAQWEGYGTTLKPAMEPIALARRPREGTVAANVIKHGTGLLDIGGNRIGDEERHNPAARNKAGTGGPFMAGKYGMPEDAEGKTVVGRHPANVLVDDSLPDLARYFFVAKPSRQEREEAGKHPTVKPVELMRHLVRLVTPPGGRVLDPFTGSGTTGVACREEGFSFHGFEQKWEFAEHARARIGARCWDCNDTGACMTYEGSMAPGYEQPPEYEICWCAAGERAMAEHEARVAAMREGA